MGANESFEQFSEKFYKKFGYLPCGKSDPLRPDAERILVDLGETYSALLKMENCFMNTRNNNKWSIAINGGAGELVGIVEENCNWFIAEEMLYDNAQMVVDLHNSQADESTNSTPNKQMVQCHYHKSKGWSCSLELTDFCKQSPCDLTLAQNH